jgi:signal transduction histidine kinase
MENDVRHPQQELEKRIFYLKALYDLSQEIGYLRETNEIIRNLLLMVIGTFGASRGILFLFDKTRRKVDAITQRGFPPGSLDLFVQEIESDDSLNSEEITDTRLAPLLSPFNLRIWVPFNIDAAMGGGIALGEKLSGDPYLPDDQELLSTLARQGAVAIENARLQQARIDALQQSKKELEQLNKAKSRALDHLSHELRTPLSVVQGNIRLIRRKTQSQTPPMVREEIYESLEKNLSRLSQIQQETDQIIRSYQKLETASRLETLHAIGTVSLSSVLLYPLTEHILDKVTKEACHRDLRFEFNGTQDLSLRMDSTILEEILVGLLKNAIENTPDEGLIRVVLERKAQWIQIKVQDFGIGITKENQRHLFEGLFHTLDTELYASKKPYDFGAGGKGLDLLRVKTYGQLFGFDIGVASQRCVHSPTDRDLCPGKISTCPHCKSAEDCYKSGGSTFCLSFGEAK